MKQSILPEIRILPIGFGWKYVLIAACTLLISITQANAQAKSITGKVTDDKGGELPGVSVLIKGTNNGTVTNSEGRYTLSVSNPDAVLVFSFIGYISEETSLNGRSTIDVQLLPDITSLTEVVVVGYGTQKKSDVTGAIVSVNEKTLREVPAANLSQALQGRAAGLQIQPTGTRPGSVGQIRVRGERSLGGSNDPLLVVDGIPYDGSINDLNPSDIKSLEILKDASATAIYGSRGANGVIIITTQRGQAGKPVVSYNGYQGVTTVARKYHLFNAEEFQKMRDVSGYGVAAGAPYLPVELESISMGRSTDWQDLLYKNGKVMNHELSVGGGTENTQYSFGGGYYKETAVLPGQSFQRYSLRMTIDQKIGKRVKIGFNTMNTFGITDGESVGAMYSILSTSPLVPAYDANGAIINQPSYPREDQYSPLLLNNKDSWAERRKRIRTFNSLYGEVEILEGLKYRLNIGLDYRQDQYGSYAGKFTPMNNGTTSTATVDNGSAYNYTIENLLTYDKTIAEKHRFGVTGLYSIQQSESNNTRISATDLVADYIQYYNLGLSNSTAIVSSDNQGYSKRVILSYMGRINYSYDDRYLLTVTGRLDGSSVLAAGNKWHAYPAVSAGWNITNESFMKDIRFLSTLKLRAGLGQTSNQAINPFQTLGSLSQNKYNFGSTNAYGYYTSTLPNPDLGWEYTKTVNIGLDYGFLNGRITGSFEVYRQRTEDILLNTSLPPTSGVPGAYLKNVGKTENKGIEFSVSTQNIIKENGFNWSTDLNIFFNRNKILALNSGVTKDLGNLWFVGQPINVIFDYEKIGIWQTNEADAATKFSQKPGQIKVKDQNNDGKITPEDDKVILGNFQPKFQGGFTNRFSYKGFDLSVVTFASIGGKLISAIHQPQSYLNMLQGRRNGIKVDYWTEQNPTNAYPKPDAAIGDNPLYGSTLGYFDATFVKIRSINLGYNLPQNWLKKISASSIRIYATVNNVATLFSPYIKAGGVDPEATGTGAQGVVANSNIPSRQLTVGANTPPSRWFMIGLNIKY
ncbi:TonB-dependent receptor [Xanthocytophaga agilis]|uniref:TonB-dependent receptor n=1 Tax=Xanthocytophaga agilis TaxID=3048010 RepID=A0AAE3UE69_9BACT|nr:TonB-dependent receptor [Xanthocytophaga agilis]MDJ1501031.1 TonB-dependent receptor [Xanthocytophaga agilis]